MKPKSLSQSSQVKGSKQESVKRFFNKLSVKLLKCFCLVLCCRETNVKNVLGASILSQEIQAIEWQNLEVGRSRQVTDCYHYILFGLLLIVVSIAYCLIIINIPDSAF